MKYEHEIEKSISYLNSAEARKSLDTNFYWPKWNSPWWHMLLLFELGESKRIPQSVVQQFVDALNKFPLKNFPFRESEVPAGLDPYDSYCHCQLGMSYQVLHACGIDVDNALPWIRPWFLKYQMEDGGLNCDNEAYLVKDECPSSMVATLPVFEAVLNCTNRPWTRDEVRFLDMAANFLIKRKLMLGSPTKHNAEEREEAKDWVSICFPRFYLYDVLRGLKAISIYETKMKKVVRRESTADVFKLLEKKFGVGPVKVERKCYENVTTRIQLASGEWVRKQKATLFPLLEKVSVIGEVSEVLTADWIHLARLKNSNTI